MGLSPLPGRFSDSFHAWQPIHRGFHLAFIGFIATALFIVGISNLYVGQYVIGWNCLICAALAYLLFRKKLTPYLEALDSHGKDD